MIEDSELEKFDLKIGLGHLKYSRYHASAPAEVV